MGSRLLSAERIRQLRVQMLALLAMVTLAGSLASFLYYSSLPYAGFEFAGRRIGSIVAGSPAEVAGLQVGDEVLALDGVPATESRAYLQPGQKTLDVTVARSGWAPGEQVTVEVALVAPSLRDRLYTTGHYLVALAFGAIATATLAFRPGSRVVQIFVLVTLTAAAILATWSLADLGLAWAGTLTSALVLIAGPLFVHFHTVFPEDRPFAGRGILLGGLYGAGLTLLGLSFVDGVPWLGPLFNAHFALCVVVGLALLIQSYRVTKSKTNKRQAAVVFLGTALVILPFVVLITIPQMFGSPYLVPTWVPLLLLILIPLSYVYAMHRRDLIRFDTAINRLVVLYLLSLTLVAIYLIISLGLRRWVPDLSSPAVTVADVILILGLAFVLDPVKRRTKLVVDRVLYGGWYDYRSSIARASERLRDADDVGDVGTLLLAEVLDTMRFSAAALLCGEMADRPFLLRRRQGFDGVLAIDRDGPLASALTESAAPVEHSVLAGQLTDSPATDVEFVAWSEAGAQMWVPLVQQGELMGVLVLGGKEGDDLVTQGDLDILDTLAGQAAVALRRLRLVDELQGRVEEVLAMDRKLLAMKEQSDRSLADELHDRILSDLFAVRHLLEPVEGRFVPEHIVKAHSQVSELSTSLRSVLFSLRPPSWEHTTLPQALCDLAWGFKQRYGLSIHIEIDGEEGEVADEVRDVLLRVLQESLNNAWKHAHAGSVQVTVGLYADRVCMAVRDDGVGFEVPKHRAGYAQLPSYGLVSMRARVDAVGGTLQVESAQGNGVCVFVEIPVVPQDVTRNDERPTQTALVHV